MNDMAIEFSLNKDALGDSIESRENQKNPVAKCYPHYQMYSCSVDS